MASQQESTRGSVSLREAKFCPSLSQKLPSSKRNLSEFLAFPLNLKKKMVAIHFSQFAMSISAYKRSQRKGWWLATIWLWYYHLLKSPLGWYLKNNSTPSPIFTGHIVTYAWNPKQPVTSLRWMFGQTTISHLKIWNRPIETTIYKWMFQVQIYIYMYIPRKSKPTKTLPLGRIGNPESMDQPEDQPLCLVDWIFRVYII